MALRGKPGGCQGGRNTGRVRRSAQTEDSTPC
jgi:hypothetical protein